MTERKYTPSLGQVLILLVPVIVASAALTGASKTLGWQIWTPPLWLHTFLMVAWIVGFIGWAAGGGLPPRTHY